MMFDEELSKALLSGCGILLSLWALSSANLGFFGLILFFISLAFVALIPITMFLDYLVLPAFTYLFRITEIPADGYEIVPEQNAIIKNVQGIYYAIGYLGISIYEYVLRREEPEENIQLQFLQGLELWERAVERFNFPLSIDLISFQRDLMATRREFEEQRDYYEYRLSKELQAPNPNALEVEALQRKIRIVNLKLNRMSSGEKPIGVLMYATVIAYGSNKQAALQNLNALIKEATVTLSNALDMKVERLSGRDLRNAFLLSTIVPPSSQELNKML